MSKQDDNSTMKVQPAVSKKTKQDILDITGGDGPWQRRVFLALLFISIPGAGHNMGITFMAPDLDYWCARPPDAANMSVEEWKKVGLPPNDKQCSRYITSNLAFPGTVSNGTITHCESWEYDDSFYTSTILGEWDLVCDRKWLVSFAKSIFMVGLLVSGVLFGILSDRVGRRPTIAGCCVLTIFFATLSAFSTSYLMFIVSRFFIAMGIGGYYNNLFVLLMEVLDPNKRILYGNLVQLGFSVGFVILPGVAWLIRDWFWIQVAITAPCLVYLGAWWFVPESPRWLLSKGRMEEARATLIQAAKTNGKDLSEIEMLLEKVMSEASEDFNSGETEGNFLDLIRTPGLRQITMILFFGWLVIGFIYYGLSFNTNDLAGDHFLNFALSGVIEFPAFLVAILVIHYLGRKKPAAGTLITGGLVCLLSYFVPQGTTFSVVLAMLGKLCVTSCYGILYVFTSELLPTVVRNTGLGWAGLFEQIGSIVSPFVRELGEYAGPFVPFLVYGLLSLTNGVLFLFLPETHDRCIPDTLNEAADATRNDTAMSRNPAVSIMSTGTPNETNVKEDVVKISSKSSVSCIEETYRSGKSIGTL